MKGGLKLILESILSSKLNPHSCSYFPHISYLPAGTSSDEHNHSNANNTIAGIHVPGSFRYIVSNINPTRLITLPPFSRGMNSVWRG